MAAGKYEYDDHDDYGIPKKLHPASRKGRLPRIPTIQYHHIRQYRTPIILALLFLILIYWYREENPDNVDWSRFAYVQYATDPHSMCNAYMIFEALKRLGSKAERVLLFPDDWNSEKNDPTDRDNQLLMRARRNLGVKLVPTQLLGLDGPAEPGTFRLGSGMDTSMTKIRIFELEEYDRVLYFDSDSLLQHHMDELFLSPNAPAAMPRQYWTDRRRDELYLSSTLMLIEPNAAETKNLWDILQKWRIDPDRQASKTYDTEIMNERFGASAMVLPHRSYILQTSEFRRSDHEAYLGSYNAPPSTRPWDAFRAIKEAKLVHFNDWPLPKPWIMWPLDGLAEMQPDCGGSHQGTCPDREVWKGLYDEFRHKRKDLCRILSVPAPEDWAKYKNMTGAG